MINGIMFGKFDTEKMNNGIGEFLREYFKEYNIPIIYNLDFGHVSPMLTLPIGAFCKINCDNEIDININLNGR